MVRVRVGRVAVTPFSSKIACVHSEHNTALTGTFPAALSACLMNG
jgi:hypothetical protein